MSDINNKKNPTHMDVLNRIRDEQGHFSPAQRQVADYVLKYFHQIPFLSISALAENIGVSNNSIIKFCNHLGFSRFAEFKRIFSDHAHSTLTTQLSPDSETKVISNDFFSQNLEEDFQVISTTLNDPINHENLPKAVSMITKAHHIYICGGSRSYPMADSLASKLQYMRLAASPVYYEPDSFWVKIRSAKPDDLVIIITMPTYSEIAVSSMKKLHKAGVPILLLTDNGLSPALPYADVALHCAYYDSFYMFSNIGVHTMINTLCRGVNYQLDIEKYHRNKDQK